jgi:hypothetical protein
MKMKHTDEETILRRSQDGPEMYVDARKLISALDYADGDVPPESKGTVLSEEAWNNASAKKIRFELGRLSDNTRDVYVGAGSNDFLVVHELEDRHKKPKYNYSNMESPCRDGFACVCQRNNGRET